MTTTDLGPKAWQLVVEEITGHYAHSPARVAPDLVTVTLNVWPTTERRATIEALESRGFTLISNGVWGHPNGCNVFIEHKESLHLQTKDWQ